MDRELAIEVYQTMVTTEAYKFKIANGTVNDVAHKYMVGPDSPVMQVIINEEEEVVAAGLMPCELTHPEGDLLSP